MIAMLSIHIGKGKAMSNLVNLLYTYPGLLSKSCGAEFGVDDIVVDWLKDCEEDQITMYVTDGIKEGFLRGIAVQETEDGYSVDLVAFEGEVDEVLELARKKLFKRIEAVIQEGHQVHPKKLAEDINERYVFRNWLTRIGWNGKEDRGFRMRLYAPLSGHTAFRTPADQKKWNERRKSKKEQHTCVDSETEVVS